MTASYREVLACSSPATSDHFTFGFSLTIAELSESCSFSSSFGSSLLFFPSFFLEA